MKRALTLQAGVAWVLFWGAVALDSASTHRRTLQAIEEAVDADPVTELYDGPPPQHGQVQRWLLWREPTLHRLRQLCRRARWWKAAAPLIAVAGPIALLLADQTAPRRIAQRPRTS